MACANLLVMMSALSHIVQRVPEARLFSGVPDAAESQRELWRFYGGRVTKDAVAVSIHHFGG